MVLFAFSVQDQVDKYGAYVAVAAFFGLAVLSLLYFAQAREVKRLREWAGRAPELGAEIQDALEEVRRAAAVRPAPAPAPQRTVLPEPVVAANGVHKLEPAEVAALAFARAAGVREPHEPKPHPVQPAAAPVAVAEPTAVATTVAPATNGTGSHAAVPPPPVTPAARRQEPAPPPLPPRRSTAAPRRGAAPPPPRRESGSRAVVITAVIGVIVLAGVAFGVTQLGGGDSNKPKPSAQVHSRRRRPSPARPPRRRRPTAVTQPTKDKALVMVFNGTATPHLAAKFQTLLTQDGYSLANVEVGTLSEAQQAQTSVVMYRKGYKPTAQGVATTLGIDAAAQAARRADAAVDVGQAEEVQRCRRSRPGQEFVARCGRCRIVARVTFVILVGATFAAFFVAQRLKSSPSVISVGRITHFFSPNGDGKRDTNQISVTLKKADDATIDVVNVDGDRVRRLADGVAMQAHRPLRLTWDGKADDGRVVPDGRYRVRVALREEGRSATVQETMTVDTRAPKSEVCVGFPCSQKSLGNIISQGDTRVKIYVKGVSPVYATKFHVLRTDQGAPKQVTSFDLRAGFHRKVWDGRVNGQPLPLGTYIVQSEVRDTAGNVGLAPAEVAVGAVRGRPGITVRGINAQPPLSPVTAGGRAEFFVDARKAPFHWQVRRVGDTAVRKRGTATDPNLVFRAPDGPSGVYLLELRSGRWHTTVPFLVQAAKRSSVLVVVPTVSWLGTDDVDDTPFDGIPNTLDTVGDTVRWPRMFNGEGGLPAGFADQVAPLLVFLDRHKIRYDLTSDLDLDLTRNPRASDRPGVLLAGSETWVTRTLAKRLHRYVTRRRARRGLRGGHAAPQRAPARARGRGFRDALERDAAGGDRSVRRAHGPRAQDARRRSSSSSTRAATMR